MSNSNKGEILIYQSENGNTKIDVLLEDEILWLTQQQLADLFQTSKQNISLHIANIFLEGELLEEATVKEYLTVRKEGKREVRLSSLTFGCGDESVVDRLPFFSLISFKLMLRQITSLGFGVQIAKA